MSHIRRNQYVLELVEFIVVSIVAGALAIVIDLILIQMKVVDHSADVSAAIALLLGWGLLGVIFWAYSALTRLLWMKLTGCLQLLALALISGLVGGVVFTAILDLNTRFIVSRLYTGDKPLVYGLLFREQAKA